MSSQSQTEKQKKNCESVCPLVRVLRMLGGRWAVPILFQLSMDGESLRFGELSKRLQPITPAELTRQLRELERLGLVNRSYYEEIPPRVEYQITTLGSSLREPLMALAGWAIEHENDLKSVDETTDCESAL